MPLGSPESGFPGIDLNFRIRVLLFKIYVFTIDGRIWTSISAFLLIILKAKKREGIRFDKACHNLKHNFQMGKPCCHF